MKKLLEIAKEQQEIFALLKEDLSSKRISEIIDSYNNPNFRVLVTGAYCRGKSTFINAILGEEILQTSLLRIPTKNIIRGGEKREANIESSEQVIKPKEVTELDKVSLVELTWDSEFFKNGIELIEYPSMTDPTDMIDFRKEVAQADLVVMLVASDALYPVTEAEVYKNVLKPNGHHTPIIIANFLDHISSKDIDEVKQAALIRLPVNKDRIFFMSAQDAIDGKEESKLTLASILKEIQEDSLERKKLKKQRLHRVLVSGQEEAFSFVGKATEQKTLQENQQNESIHAWRKKLKTVQELSIRIQRDLNEFRQDNKEIIEGKLSNYFQELSRKIEDWANTFTGAQLREFLNEKINTSIQKFTKNEFSPYIEKSLKQQEDLLTNGFKQYQNALTKLYELLSIDVPSISMELDILKSLPEVETINLAGGNNKEEFKKGFRIQNLIQTPKALISIVGAAIGSIVYTHLAPILVPVGIGASIFFATKNSGTKSSQEEILAYKLQIENQGKKIQSLALAETNDVVGKLQSQISRLLNETTNAAEKEVNAQIKKIQNQSVDIKTFEQKLKQMQHELAEFNFDAS